MQKKLLVESDPYETRVAILEQDRLTELFIERHGQLGVVGNIYKGRVHRVLPGMQAAFVDVGLDRDAFLYVSEVIDPSLEDLDEPSDLGSPDAASDGSTKSGSETEALDDRELRSEDGDDEFEDDDPDERFEARRRQTPP